MKSTPHCFSALFREMQACSENWMTNTGIQELTDVPLQCNHFIKGLSVSPLLGCARVKLMSYHLSPEKTHLTCSKHSAHHRKAPSQATVRWASIHYAGETKTTQKPMPEPALLHFTVKARKENKCTFPFAHMCLPNSKTTDSKCCIFQVLQLSNHTLQLCGGFCR